MANRRGRVAKSAVGMLIAAGLACQSSNPTVRSGPLTFDVKLVEGDAGSQDSPLAFQGTHRVTLEVTAIAFDGSVAVDFDDSVAMSIGPNGRFLTGTPREISVSGGKATRIDLEFERAHGDVQIWFEHTGNEDDPGSFATGLSPTIHVHRPTIREAQEVTVDIETSNLEFDQVRFRTEGRTIVATGTTQNGFYATDLDDPSFGSIFVFTFSAPEGVTAGSRIVELSGGMEEFFGLTELSFPSYKVDGEATVPDPVLLQATDMNDDLYLESLEAALVEVRDITVCPTGSDYATFGQWTAILTPSASCTTGSGAITILSTQSVPDFDPTQVEGAVLPSVKGNLRFHVAANPPWILYPRDANDLVQ